MKIQQNVLANPSNQNTTVQTQQRSQSTLPNTLSQRNTDPFASPILNSSIDTASMSTKPTSNEFSTDWSNAFDENSSKTNDPFSNTSINAFESPGDPFSNSKFSEDPWSNPNKSTPSFETAFGSVKKIDSANKIGDPFGNENLSSKTIMSGFGNDDDNWTSINTANQNLAISSIAYFFILFFLLSRFAIIKIIKLSLQFIF
jgi:hypothetical protein